MLQNTGVLLHITKYNDFITKCDNYYKMRRLLQSWPSFPKTIWPPRLVLSRLKDGNSLIAFDFELAVWNRACSFDSLAYKMPFAALHKTIQREYIFFSARLFLLLAYLKC